MINSVAVHDGVFHADDVFAVAILTLLNPELTVIRSRNTEVLAGVDLRVDVGGAYNDASGDFDHHMTGGADNRTNGIPYASCGLIWRHFGMELAKSKFCFDHIDKKLIQSIDAIDSGFSFAEIDGEFIHYNISDAVDSFNPVWFQEEQDYDGSFARAILYAKEVIMNELRKAEGFERSHEYVYAKLDDNVNPYYIVFDRYVPWQQIITNETDLLYVLFPASTGDWRIRAVPTYLGSFDSRKPLPKSWGGKRDNELIELSGVEDALFCHPARFIAGATTLEGAIALVEAAL